ncbi:unnamed protein product [Coregonus sp. 'balchen']|nr:unnamed protein product [Coregonus sp. 'balchen']
MWCTSTCDQHVVGRHPAGVIITPTQQVSPLRRPSRCHHYADPAGVIITPTQQVSPLRPPSRCHHYAHPAGVIITPTQQVSSLRPPSRDTSGQGRFCTIFRSYSRGAQGILLVYDIANRWSFEGIDRWIREIDEHAPGVPRILVGNRLHLAFKRQVPTEQARAYAEKNGMTFFEVSPLCNFNVIESFTELSRIDLCCRAIVSCTPVHLIDKLPLPVAIKSHLKSFSMANGMNAVMMHGRSYSLANVAGGSKGNSLKRSKSIKPPQSPPQNCTRNNCKIS